MQLHRHEAGISLYTLLAAVVVLGVLTSVLVTSFTGTHSKGEALYAMLSNYGQASNRFHLDTSCYPVDIDALVNVDALQDSSRWYSNSCKTPIPAALWHGPYIKVASNVKSVSGDHLPVTQFGPDASITFNGSEDTDGTTAVIAVRLQPDIARAAYDACGGDGSLCKLSHSDQTRGKPRPLRAGSRAHLPQGD